MVAQTHVARSRDLRSHLSVLARNLRQVQSVIAVSVAALQQQNCEIDADVASVLRRGAHDRLQDQVESIEALAATLALTARTRRADGSRR